MRILLCKKIKVKICNIISQTRYSVSCIECQEHILKIENKCVKDLTLFGVAIRSMIKKQFFHSEVVQSIKVMLDYILFSHL